MSKEKENLLDNAKKLGINLSLDDDSDPKELIKDTPSPKETKPQPKSEKSVEPKVETQVPNNEVNKAVTETPTPIVNTINEEVAPPAPVIDMPQQNEEAVSSTTPEVIVNPTPAESIQNNTVAPNAEVAASEPITIVNEEHRREEPKPIYGGASPVIPKIDVGEEHRPIYGGADPLENTGAIPTINNQVSTPIPKIDAEPKVEPVEPVIVATPHVETPTVESTRVEGTKQEVVTPTVTEPAPKVESTQTASKQEVEVESLF